MFSNTNNDTQKLIQTRELGSIIESALARIPEDYRLVFSLREINGFSVTETANVLNISESNVKVRLNRSKSMLRNEIENKYAARDLFEFKAIHCDGMVFKVMKRINGF